MPNLTKILTNTETLWKAVKSFLTGTADELGNLPSNQKVYTVLLNGGEIAYEGITTGEFIISGKIGAIDLMFMIDGLTRLGQSIFRLRNESKSDESHNNPFLYVKPGIIGSLREGYNYLEKMC